MTLEVAVLNAGGCGKSEILSRLRQASPQVTQTEVDMALLRLKRIAGMWKTPSDRGPGG